MNEIKLVGKYIGPNKIIRVKYAKRKTYLGKPVVEVELSNDTKKEYPLEMIESITTDEPKDLTELRELVTNIATEKVLMLLTETEMAIEDAKYMLQTKVANSIEVNTGMAYKKFWGKEHWEVSLYDIDRYLKENGKPKKGKNGTSSK